MMHLNRSLLFLGHDFFFRFFVFFEEGNGMESILLFFHQ